MQLLKNKLSIAVLFFALAADVASAAHHSPKIVIDKGGFIFSAPYKLHKQPSGEDVHSELVVEAYVARVTEATRCYNGPIWPGPYGMGLHFRFNDADASISFGRRQKIYNVKNISSSSEWYPGLLKLVTKFGTQFDPTRHQKKKQIHGMPKAAASLRIESLPGCRLHATYNMRIANSLPRHSLRTRHPLRNTGSLVQVDAQERALKNHPGKKVLVLKATFGTGNKNGRSSIKFKRTETGLHEISRKNIKRSSRWYPWVKKIVEKSANRYLRYRHKHNKIAGTI